MSASNTTPRGGAAGPAGSSASAGLLSYEQFLAVTTALRGDTDRSGGGRRDPRAPMRGRVIVIPLSLADVGRNPVAGWVRDVSRSGVGLTLDQPVPEKTPVILAMARAGPSGSGSGTFAWLLGIVVSRFQLQAGGVGHGVKLVRELSGVEALGARQGEAEILLALNSDAAHSGEKPFEPAQNSRARSPAA